MYKKVVALEELAVIIPVVTSILIPFVIIGLNRYLKGSDKVQEMAKLNVLTERALTDVDEYIVNNKKEMREMWKKIEELDKSLYQLCWRIENIEKALGNNHARRREID